MLEDTKCPCGKEGRYIEMVDDVETYSCNKYQRCPTYEELLVSNRNSDRYTWAYRNFVNNIDDYFEYSCESKRDQKKVHQLLQNLTETLVRVENENRE